VLLNGGLDPRTLLDEDDGSESSATEDGSQSDNTGSGGDVSQDGSGGFRAGGMRSASDLEAEIARRTQRMIEMVAAA
jgi:hypothetical protein